MEKILTKDSIQLDKQAANSIEAIEQVGRMLIRGGYVTEEYINGMIKRDQSLSTYIGNDIAIPHGEFDSIKFVKKTGICILVYPKGVPWGEGTARIVIGIAAKDNDHMPILSSLAIKLSEMDEVEKVVNGTVDSIYEMFSSENL